MAGIAECLEGALHTVMGPGMGIYWQPAGAADAVDRDLMGLTGEMTTEGRVTLFVRNDVPLDEALRNYLHRDPSLLGDLDVRVVGPNGEPAGLADEQRVANFLDLPVKSSQRPGAFKLDANGSMTLDERAPRLVLPETVEAQRTAANKALSTPRAADPAGRFAAVNSYSSSPTLLDRQPTYGALPAGERIPHTATHALGVFRTYVGDGVPGAVRDLLLSPQMITPHQLVAAIGGADALRPARPEQLANHLTANPGRFALVLGQGQAHFLLPDAENNLHWAPPGGTGTVPFDVEGMHDPFTQLLEGKDARVLVLDPNGAVVPIDGLDKVALAPPAEFNLPTDARALPGGGTMIGQWPEQTVRKLGLDQVDLTGTPRIQVDVRLNPGTKDLAPGLDNALHNAGFRYFLHDNRPLVLSTVETPQVIEAANLSGGVALYPTPLPGLDSNVQWNLHVPETGATTVLGTGKLTQDMIEAAKAALAQLPTLYRGLPQQLKNLLSLNSYAEAREHWSNNLADLRSPEVGEALRSLAAEFPHEPVVQVMRLAHTIGERTDFRFADPPIEPKVRNSLETEPALPPELKADLSFVFDYLTARDLSPATPGGEPPGPYQTRLLWDGLLFRMMLGRNLTRDESLILINGVNADEYSKAVKSPEALAVSGAHAAIFNAIHQLEQAGLAWLNEPDKGNQHVNINWGELLSAVDCLPGEDRVPWHFRLNKVLEPHLEASKMLKQVGPALAEMRSMIYLCH